MYYTKSSDKIINNKKYENLTKHKCPKWYNKKKLKHDI